MHKRLKVFVGLCALLLIALAHGASFGVYAQSEEDKLQELQKQITEYTNQIQSLQAQAGSLSNEVAQFNAKISLTELKINQTQEQISLLGGRINQLESSLDTLEEAFTSRIQESYKMSRVSSSPLFAVTTSNAGDAVQTFYYLRRIQEADQALLERLKSANDTYKNQKGDLESLEKVLGAQKEELGSQKAAKANLLAVTKNDEKRYQSLLAAARAEFEAIQEIVAGHGDETEVGHINAGERIASIIQGPSCNSSGAHLHFIVASGGNTHNPFSYLKSGVDYDDCSGTACGSGDGDAFTPSGGWDWPISPRIRFSQGYGSTWATRNSWVGKIYNFHNGIDIDSENSSEVKAVQAGTLFRGSFGGSNGCRLRYVRVRHDGSDIETYYLHVNY
ncbi:hypothetical protein C4564_01980 [Candidatus Microgenomates bacterium]|nr:MAG: hypothetical protein C4564_01980 [Candidatus Microgenomates bacterium]